MPRHSDADDMISRRRANGSADAMPAEPGLLMRILLYSPKDLIAGFAAFAAVSAIIANAIFLQAGRHPSPMFGSSAVVPLFGAGVANPLPRPRPIEASSKPAERTLDSRLLEGRAVEIKVSVPKPSEHKAADPSAGSVKTGAAPSSAAIRPPAPIPARGDPLGDLITSSRRVASVQRVLTEFGYGQLKLTGQIGSETSAAIQKFERERKLPVTGQMSDRLVRELAAVTGRPID